MAKGPPTYAPGPPDHVELPPNVPDHVKNDAIDGGTFVERDMMRIEDAYDDAWVVIYRWDDGIELDDHQRSDREQLVEQYHDGYETKRVGIDDDGEFFVRYDYAE